MRTRAVLIEIAGQTFAELGYDGATGQEICRRAGVNTAAIVYHFDGMVGLYRAVLTEAHQRFVTTDRIVAAVQAQSQPRGQLEALIGLIVQAATSPASQTWAGRLLAREVVTPSTVTGSAHRRSVEKQAALLRKIVGTLIGKPVNDPLVAYGCISVMAPCVLLLLVNHRKIRRFAPQIRLDARAAPRITRYLTEFALAGLSAKSPRPG